MHLIGLHDTAGSSLFGLKFLYMKALSSLKTTLAFILPNFKPNTRIGPHNEEVISVIVGSLLGDGYAERLQNGGVRIRFRQQVKHKEYIFWLHGFLYERGYCTKNLPVLFEQKYGDKIYQAYRFGTLGFSSWMWLYKLFYTNNKVKVIPQNISELLTPLALAIWISSSSQSPIYRALGSEGERSSRLCWEGTSGKFINGNIELPTEFTREKDIDILISAIKDSFGLVCKKYKNKKNYYTVFIPKEYETRLQFIISSYNIPCNRYKLNYNKISINNLTKRFYSSNNNPNSSQGSSTEAVASYSNSLDLRSTICKENLNKAGIYRWTNLITGKTYIGSSSNLGKRFSGYYSIKFLERETLKTKSMIYFALLKYGHSSFKLEILEYCDSKVLISREQKYLDLLKPEYNILDKAGSSLGFKHSESTIAKFKEISNSRIYSEERKAKFAALNLNRTE